MQRAQDCQARRHHSLTVNLTKNNFKKANPYITEIKQEVKYEKSWLFSLYAQNDKPLAFVK